ncbi:hypothetical protein [Halegenticoccus tardaugens]|uniref:hypothetical protein n=1 Tax=Halegenticoccus tardaugens TaxID=2071624 RepID=UPI00100A3004|nr:hypothetical protein [Halegenticoccus tardaugens]
MREPNIQITERHRQQMRAPRVEVLAWWSLSDYDRYVFVETSPAWRVLEFHDGLRTYETEYGLLTERISRKDVPPSIHQRLAEKGYTVGVDG